MNTMLKTMKTALAAAAFVAVGAAQATIVTSTTNNPLTFTWDFLTDVNTHLTGSGSMALSGFGTGSLVVAIVLNNTSLLGGQGGERLTSFGFGIDPNATSISFFDPQGADGGMIGAALGQTFPNVQGIEVCAFGGNNCPGGSNGGIFATASDSFSVMLGGTWGSSVDIAPIGFKYQTGYGSFEFTSSTNGAPSGSTGRVPEPGTHTLAFLGLGLLGVGYGLRRKSLKG